MKAPPLIVGNWKMHKTRAEARAFMADFLPQVRPSERKILIAPPFTSIETVVEMALGTQILIGAQNVHDAGEGAFTGEVSCRMLKESGAQFVIVGHSERRILFAENNRLINRKIRSALAEGLMVVFCIGETLEEKELQATETVLSQQMEEGLEGVTDEELKSVVIAYEPVWAIGTGRAATPEIAQTVHQKCRTWIEKTYGSASAEQLCIVYGGSVKPDRISALMEQRDIGGVLVGGGALDPYLFAQLVNF